MMGEEKAVIIIARFIRSILLNARPFQYPSDVAEHLRIMRIWGKKAGKYLYSSDLCDFEWDPHKKTPTGSFSNATVTQLPPYESKIKTTFANVLDEEYIYEDINASEDVLAAQRQNCWNEWEKKIGCGMVEEEDILSHSRKMWLVIEEFHRKSSTNNSEGESQSYIYKLTKQNAIQFRARMLYFSNDIRGQWDSAILASELISHLHSVNSELKWQKMIEEEEEKEKEREKEREREKLAEIVEWWGGDKSMISRARKGLLDPATETQIMGDYYDYMDDCNRTKFYSY